MCPLITKVLIYLRRHEIHNHTYVTLSLSGRSIHNTYVLLVANVLNNNNKTSVCTKESEQCNLKCERIGQLYYRKNHRECRTILC